MPGPGAGRRRGRHAALRSEARPMAPDNQTSGPSSERRYPTGCGAPGTAAEGEGRFAGGIEIGAVVLAGGDTPPPNLITPAVSTHPRRRRPRRAGAHHRRSAAHRPPLVTGRVDHQGETGSGQPGRSPSVTPPPRQVGVVVQLLVDPAVRGLADEEALTRQRIGSQQQRRLPGAGAGGLSISCHKQVVGGRSGRSSGRRRSKRARVPRPLADGG